MNVQKIKVYNRLFMKQNFIHFSRKKKYNFLKRKKQPFISKIKIRNVDNIISLNKISKQLDIRRTCSA